MTKQLLHYCMLMLIGITLVNCRNRSNESGKAGVTHDYLAEDFKTPDADFGRKLLVVVAQW